MADYPDELDPFSEKVSDKSILKKITALVKLKESQPLTNTFASTAKKDPSPFMLEIVEQIENRRQYLQDYADAREAFLLEQQANEEEYESALEAKDRASDARYEERQLNKETAELQSSFDRSQRTEQKRFENELKRFDEKKARIQKEKERSEAYEKSISEQIRLRELYELSPAGLAEQAARVVFLENEAKRKIARQAEVEIQRAAYNKKKAEQLRAPVKSTRKRTPAHNTNYTEGEVDLGDFDQPEYKRYEPPSDED